VRNFSFAYSEAEASHYKDFISEAKASHYKDFISEASHYKDFISEAEASHYKDFISEAKASHYNYNTLHTKTKVLYINLKRTYIRIIQHSL